MDLSLLCSFHLCPSFNVKVSKGQHLTVDTITIISMQNGNELCRTKCMHSMTAVSVSVDSMHQTEHLSASNVNRTGSFHSSNIYNC